MAEAEPVQHRIQRRGRLPEPPSDPTAPDGREFSFAARLGWLLRTWRLHAGHHYGFRFAAELTALGVPAEASQVSRWESGRRVPPLRVVVAYERLTGAPEGVIQASSLGGARLPGARPAPGLADVAFDANDVAALLDDALSGAATAGQWLRLATQIAAAPERVTMPRRAWPQLTATLMEEVGRSIGAAWAPRYEAAVLIARHPHGRAALLDSVVELASQRDSPNAVDHISVLKDLPDPDVRGLVLTLLEEGDGAVFEGALAAAGALLVRGDLDAAELRRLEDRLLRVVAVRGPDAGGIFVQVKDLVANLPPASLHRVSRRMPALTQLVPPPTAGPRPGGVTAGASPKTVARSPRLVADLVDDLGEDLGNLGGLVGDSPTGHLDDPLLTRLVGEILHHTDSERRVQNNITLLASPIREPLTRRAVALLTRADQPLSRTDRSRILSLVTFTTTGAQDHALAELVRHGGPGAELALVALAHSPAPRHEIDPLVLLEAPAWAGHTRRVVYYAGMTGHPHLALMAADPRWSDEVRGTSGWWLRAGPAIR